MGVSVVSPTVEVGSGEDCEMTGEGGDVEGAGVGSDVEGVE